MTDDARSLAQEAGELVAQSGSLSNFIRDFGLAGILYAIFLVIIRTIDAAGELILAPFRALAGGIVSLIDGTVGSGVDVIGAGAATAIESFTTGVTALLGPFAFPFSVGVTMIAVFVFIWFIQRLELSPLIFIRNTVRR